MLDGIYTITFRGEADWGMGMLIFQDGQIIGADVGGVQYDGSYIEEGTAVTFDVTMTVPPGSTLVQGTPARSTAYTVPVKTPIPRKAFETGEPVLIDMGPGPVNVIFRRLRTLKSDIR